MVVTRGCVYCVNANCHVISRNAVAVVNRRRGVTRLIDSYTVIVLRAVAATSVTC